MENGKQVQYAPHTDIMKSTCSGYYSYSDLLATFRFFLRLTQIIITISASNSNATAAPVTPPATAPTDGPEDASLAATVGVCVNVGVLLTVANSGK